MDVGCSRSVREEYDMGLYCQQEAIKCEHDIQSIKAHYSTVKCFVKISMIQISAEA